MTTAIFLVGGLLAAGLAITAITHWAANINDRIETMVTEALAIEADDWNEPTRADVDWDAWVDQALRMSETPIHDATAEHVARLAASDLDAEWADLNGGAS